MTESGRKSGHWGVFHYLSWNEADFSAEVFTSE